MRMQVVNEHPSFAFEPLNSLACDDLKDASTIFPIASMQRRRVNLLCFTGHSATYWLSR